jgi:hypothetical protein
MGRRLLGFRGMGIILEEGLYLGRSNILVHNIFTVYNLFLFLFFWKFLFEIVNYFLIEFNISF